MAQQPVINHLRLFRNSFYIILLLGALMHWFALPKVTLLSQQDSAGITRKNLQMPLTSKTFPEKLVPHEYTATIDYGYKSQQTVFIVHPQFCIKRISLNGFPVSFPLEQSCLWGEGAYIDLANHLSEGKNILRLELKGPGISIAPAIFSGNASLSDILGYLLIAASCAALFFLMWHLLKDPIPALMIAASWVFYLYLMNQTHFMWKKYDMPQHLDYITYIANFLRWPNIYHGFLTYHPPLYYTLQALAARTANFLGSFDSTGILRLCNVIYFTGFIVFAALTLRLILKQRITYYLCLGMLLLYPGGLVLSARMDSDLLFYPFFSGSLYFLLRWIKEGTESHVKWMLIFCGLSIGTRTNGILLFPLIGLGVLYRWYKYQLDSLLPLFTRRALWIGIAVVIIGISMNFGRAAYGNITTNRNQSYIVGNANYMSIVARGLYVHNGWDSYLSFNMQEYLSSPFFNVWWDAGGRYYFWITVIKSSLYGEFSFLPVRIAQYLNYLMLGFILYIFASVATGTFSRRPYSRQYDWLFMVFTLLIPIIGLAANRLLHPMACSQDFRYIYPAIVSFCGMIAFCMEQHLQQDRKLMALAGGAGILCFIGLSMLFSARMEY